MNGLMIRKEKLSFEVNMVLEELLNVPYITNQCIYAKVRLLCGGFRYCSASLCVQDHVVRWDERFNFTCKMTVNPSTSELGTCICRVSVRQEVRGGTSFKKLGYADINLSEFTGYSDTRRYLLKAYSSKHRMHNAILKVTVAMTLLSGHSSHGSGYPSIKSQGQLRKRGTIYDLSSLEKFEANKKSRIDDTRIDPNDIINQIFIDTGLLPP